MADRSFSEREGVDPLDSIRGNRIDEKLIRVMKNSASWHRAWLVLNVTPKSNRFGNNCQPNQEHTPARFVSHYNLMGRYRVFQLTESEIKAAGGGVLNVDTTTDGGEIRSMVIPMILEMTVRRLRIRRILKDRAAEAAAVEVEAVTHQITRLQGGIQR